jgi:hypothetical protein
MRTPILALAGTTQTGLSATATTYVPLCMGVAESAYKTAVVNVEQVVPVAGTFSNLRVKFPAPTGATKSWTITLFVNGIASALTTQVVDAATTNFDIAHTVPVNRGDTVCMQIVPANTPSGVNTAAQISLAFDAAANQSAIFAHASCSGAATNYAGFGNAVTAGAVENVVSCIISTSGTLDRLYVNMSAAPGAGKSFTFTIFKNGASTGVTCQVSTAALNSSDLSNSITVVAGDLISIQSVPSGAPSTTTAKISMRWAPTIDGESLQFCIDTTALSSSAARYLNVNGNSINSATETDFENLAPTIFVAKKLQVAHLIAPGGTASRNYIFRANETSPSGTLTATIANTNTTASDIVNGYTTVAGDRLAFMTTPTNTPAAAVSAKLGWVAFTMPSGGSLGYINMTMMGVG